MARLLIACAALAAALAAVGSAAALNPQPWPPRVAGIVRDACTGLPVTGATVTLTPVDILLAPLACRPPNPNFHPPNPNLPALTGAVRDATTGLPITNAQETLTPTTGERDPGPPSFSGLGLFSWPTLDAGGYTLTLTTPGYRDPGPTGIPVTRNPGPGSFPDGSAVTFATTLDIQLTRTD